MPSLMFAPIVSVFLKNVSVSSRFILCYIVSILRFCVHVVIIILC